MNLTDSRRRVLNYSQNIESLNKGIYYLKIETEKSSIVEKIIKE